MQWGCRHGVVVGGISAYNSESDCLDGCCRLVGVLYEYHGVVVVVVVVVAVVVVVVVVFRSTFF